MKEEMRRGRALPAMAGRRRSIILFRKRGRKCRRIPTLRQKSLIEYTDIEYTDKAGVCMDIVQEYLSFVTEVVSFFEYENQKSVRAYNCKAKRMRRIATEIEQGFPDLKISFCELLCHENREIRLWVAHHILEVMNYDERTRIAALQEIRYSAANDKGATGLGHKLWLERWYDQHPGDKFL